MKLNLISYDFLNQSTISNVDFNCEEYRVFQIGSPVAETSTKLIFVNMSNIFYLLLLLF